MSDIMRPIPFDKLMDWALTEYEKHGTIFGVEDIYRHESGKGAPIFNELLETPFGPAAGPHTQLAQNLIASYAGGGRFFELKTVQVLDGEDLPVDKPCILAGDEGYNVEWSTELTVPQAMDEYIKGWYAVKLLSRQLGLGSEDGFVFNMSVGYDLEGIKTEKIDNFIEGLKDASKTPVWGECEAWAKKNLGRLGKLDESFINGLNPRVCTSITLSTLHGCPSHEIERIASYLLEEKRLNTYIKCNPTLLGYEFTRKTLDSMGYGYMSFDDSHFKADLQFEDAVPMIERLLDKAKGLNLEFGVKLTNTFPVKIEAGELPGEQMYMSGKSLYPLTIALAAKLEKEFKGKLRASYSGGADYLNIAEIFETGIWPITVCTTLLKPGGYNRLRPMAEALSRVEFKAFTGIDIPALIKLSEKSQKDSHHMKAKKMPPSRKLETPAPFTDCFTAGCKGGCPLGQDIPEYIMLLEQGKFSEALEVIVKRNPLPFITGSICYERCADRCVRSFNDESVRIRELKLEAAEKGSESLLENLTPGEKRSENVAVIGGGPAGMAAAWFLRKAGAAVTIFEKRDKLGGIVRYGIPESKISGETIDKDIAFLEKLGVEMKLGTRVESIGGLLSLGYSHVIVACGAWEPGKMKSGEFLSALGFIESGKDSPKPVADEEIKTAGAAGELARKARAKLDENLCAGNGIYVIGDAVRGNGSVADSIADAHLACGHILGAPAEDKAEDAARCRDCRCKGDLRYFDGITDEPSRCLDCGKSCEICVDVCPNRANMSVNVPGGNMAQVVHIDELCNECGNCLVFCPYSGSPYKDKFTLFGSQKDFDDSKNSGFLPLDRDGKQVKIRLEGEVYTADLQNDEKTPVELRALMTAVIRDYPYCI